MLVFTITAGRGVSLYYNCRGGVLVFTITAGEGVLV